VEKSFFGSLFSFFLRQVAGGGWWIGGNQIIHFITS
jgi:hypothetical protein